MSDPPYRLVLETVRHVCTNNRWTLYAAHVGPGHVHIVVSTEKPPEKVLGYFKAHSTRTLGASGQDPDRKHHWAGHGSTVWLWNREETRQAIDYVVNGQGEPLRFIAG